MIVLHGWELMILVGVLVIKVVLDVYQWVQESRTSDRKRCLQVKLLSGNAQVPTKGTSGSAGWDVYAAEDIEVAPTYRGGATMVKTDLSVALPKGCYGRIADRSSMAANHGITCGAGVVDSSYRGEIKVVLFNLTKDPYSIKKGERIAQLIVEKIEDSEVQCVEDLSVTERGSGGFGSTGK